MGEYYIYLIRDGRVRPRSFVEVLKGMVHGFLLLRQWEGRDENFTDGSQSLDLSWGEAMTRTTQNPTPSK